MMINSNEKLNLIKSLNGSWEFRSADSDEWYSATVPGCNFLDLMDNKLIPDPFIKLNEKEVSWVGEKDFVYRKTFRISKAEYSSNEIILVAKMLDTICDVSINDSVVFSSNNCFVENKHNIKEFLKVGNNEISIYFHSPVNFVKDKYKSCPTPINSNGQNGIVHIRKPQCHFGWDWGPVLPLSGITDDIYLEFVGAGNIDSFSVLASYDMEVGRINASAKINSYDETKCIITVEEPNGTVRIEQGTSAQFVITNPELWWTKELSGKDEQPLYKVSAILYDKNDKIVSKTSKNVGIRKLELNRELDEYGKNFQFVLNGVPIFAKGANYIPPDSFITRFDEDKMNYLLDSFQFSNMNVLRIWGGGYYGSDALYDACDKRGILVWQDFMFACQAYPFFDEEFLSNVKSEIAYNVARISSHPSLALYCGNNEIEDMHMAWLNMPKYISWTEEFFYNILESEIRKIDPITPYTQGSPIGKSHNEGVGADNVGDTHLWGVWHGLKPMTYYRKRMTRFCSEFGFESLPDMNSIRIFSEPKDYKLNSKVFLSHQKCKNGNDKMVYYIASRFNLPKHFRDYVYLSQVTQLECIADATEHWRRNKGRCNGSMYWQFNDCWGVCSWSSIDYYGNYKALQYGAKHFNEPITVSFEDNKDNIKVFVLNDLIENQNLNLKVSLFNFEKGEIETDNYEINDLDYKISFDIPQSWLKNYSKKTHGIVATLYKNSEIISRKTLLLKKEKSLSLPKSKLKTKIEIKGNDLVLNIKSDKFARLVKAECSGTYLPFSDNFFDLLPNEEKTIIMHLKDGMDKMEIAKSIVVYSLADIPFSKNKLKSISKRIKVYFSPVNIANALHHGKVPKDIKL